MDSIQLSSGHHAVGGSSKYSWYMSKPHFLAVMWNCQTSEERTSRMVLEMCNFPGGLWREERTIPTTGILLLVMHNVRPLLLLIPGPLWAVERCVHAAEKDRFKRVYE